MQITRQATVQLAATQQSKPVVDAQNQHAVQSQPREIDASLLSFVGGAGPFPAPGNRW